MTAVPNRVLLVEDNPDDLELARIAFRRAEFASLVDVARDGAEALDYLFAQGAWAHRGSEPPPRLVLLDIKLPLVDGIEVLRRLKGDPGLRHVPVVMMTSSAQDRDLSACYELGANSYIVKPVDMEKFLAVIQGIGLYWLVLNEPDPDAGRVVRA
ncbi:response regulator [Cellulomonas aerilata]|uniref:Response regulator n=1 Tax=Cellulomonas aerilata TaxID=515326 RepID=A0A512DA69_9CELL|nr:response regulator [Cellulomonas aerilata]GEO33382.1 response regulator [Cellulomonas aerilata]